MKTLLTAAAALVFLLLPTLLAVGWVSSAGERMVAAETSPEQMPATVVAQQANAGYCSPELKQVLRRVLQSCGLLGTGQVRGCQPADARQVAALAGEDFNALFTPMAERAGVIQFDREGSSLDDSDKQLIDALFADQRGASYFFVVARASPEGSVAFNRALSEKRAAAVMDHLRTTFDDPDLDREVGLLWLGEEFAQLDEQFCSWQRSGDEASCASENLNRSAFVTWIDCRL